MSKRSLCKNGCDGADDTGGGFVAHFVGVPIESVDERDVRTTLSRDLSVLLDVRELDAERGTKPCRPAWREAISGDGRVGRVGFS